MGDARGFLKTARQEGAQSEKASEEQASRCMDCGTPFCHWACPLGNYIPEWNDYASSGKWEKAVRLLDATNNLAEITGRLCPAPCEYACVLGINDDAVTVRENELTAIEYGFREGLIKPVYPGKRTGKRVAVVGSGPAGLSAASQLNRAGHEVVVFEKDKKPGGILRYGIPDFKLEKHLVERRLDIWKKEGVVFKTGVEVGKDYPVRQLLDGFDAVCLACGSRVPRDLGIPGRELKGIYFAMDYLIHENKNVSGEKTDGRSAINARGKKVVVIGGGDTGADCVETARMQGARSITQIEVMPMPAECRTSDYPWPGYPLILKKPQRDAERHKRHWAVLTKSFMGKNGFVKKLSCVKVEFLKDKEKTCPLMKEIPRSKFELETDLVIIAIGFLYPERAGLISELEVKLDERGTVKTDESYRTSIEKVFCAGDMRRGQSLIVWAVSEGRRSAYFIDKYLMDRSDLALV